MCKLCTPILFIVRKSVNNLQVSSVNPGSAWTNPSSATGRLSAEMGPTRRDARFRSATPTRNSSAGPQETASPSRYYLPLVHYRSLHKFSWNELETNHTSNLFDISLALAALASTFSQQCLLCPFLLCK